VSCTGFPTEVRLTVQSWMLGYSRWRCTIWLIFMLSFRRAPLTCPVSLNFYIYETRALAFAQVVRY
jgi:hypothetical protein